MSMIQNEVKRIGRRVYSYAEAEIYTYSYKCFQNTKRTWNQRKAVVKWLVLAWSSIGLIISVCSLCRQTPRKVPRSSWPEWQWSRPQIRIRESWSCYCFCSRLTIDVARDDNGIGLGYDTKILGFVNIIMKRKSE